MSILITDSDRTYLFSCLCSVHTLSIFNRLKVIRLFRFGWDFRTGGEIFEILGEMSPKKGKFRKTLAWRALPWH